VSPDIRFLVGFFRERPLSSVGVLILLFFVFLWFFGGVLAPYDPQSGITEFMQPPSSAHWMGTDRAGLDVFSRVISSPRVDLTIGVIATALAVTIGTPLGVISGYFHNWLGSSLGRTFDVIQCLPPFIVAMCLVAFAGQSMTNVILVLALLNSPIYVRLVRSKVNSVQQRKFVEAATCLGNAKWRIILRHLIPNSLEPVLVQFPVNVGWAILMAAALSFVGAGVRPPTPEWGAMIASGAPLLIMGQWWTAVFPGIAVGLCVMGLALTASALEILLDPTRR
jgi:peptide/nickel transport system permease protein